MKKIHVTTPLLPSLDDLTPLLEDIWDRRWLTNNGYYHHLLEKRLCDYLGVDYICLFSNGTLALMAALQALDLNGEVITTPYSFVATSHAIKLNNLTPVFVDIDPETFNLDPSKVEAAITNNTCAILPVHVYGSPCDVEHIKSIAEKYNLKVIYDAAHAFGVKKNNYSILNWGDLSILSFHATKAYSTIEGGAIVCHTLEMKEKLEQLKNFGFESETELSLLGINAKLNEVQSAFGLASLSLIDDAISRRKQVAFSYRKFLSNIDGISYLDDSNDTHHNYSYFPIIIDKVKYGMSRDELFNKLKENNVFARRYFYPLITDFELYKDSKICGNISIAKNISDNVICLPMHHELSNEDLCHILNLIYEFKRK
ncbi:DegT/DnrJ/EryC1/StrS family aminotransferase [Edwardsiella tarda]|uniref:DegT/DnrJ/EryC1/StrS family aminotransferase n=1 Tax=Edwardsiella tarda TaxID=636 RepID=UPI00351C691D